MKIKMTAGSYVRSSEHLLEMKSGGGCVSLFGLPFFFAGLFMILISTGVIPLSNGDDVPFWGMLIIACMGLIFSAVGGALVFARQWHTIDRRQMRLWISRGLMKPMRSSYYDLRDFEEVRIRYVKGDSDTADRYPLVLISTKGIPELELCTATSYGQARSQAILIGEFWVLGSRMPAQITCNRWKDLRNLYKRRLSPHILQERILSSKKGLMDCIWDCSRGVCIRRGCFLAACPCCSFCSLPGALWASSGVPVLLL